MEMVLIKDDHWPIVCEERPRPANIQSGKSGSASAGSSRTCSSTTSGLVNSNEEVQKWIAHARNATVNIFFCLGDGAERQVNNNRNPVDLWEKLQQIYE